MAERVKSHMATKFMDNVLNYFNNSFKNDIPSSYLPTILHTLKIVGLIIIIGPSDGGSIIPSSHCIILKIVGFLLCRLYT